jgi:hypothetical protein
VPALPGIVTYGPTLEDAREMARDAIACHLRGLLRDGEEIPKDPFQPHAHRLPRSLKSPFRPACRPNSPISSRAKSSARCRRQVSIFTNKADRTSNSNIPTSLAGLQFPYHDRFDLPKHIVKSIIRQAGLTNSEFFDLLAQ